VIYNKIVLGSAQFGMNYGISNREGKTKSLDIKKILSKAKKKRILFIDTSKYYGNSEKNLGEQEIKKFKLITKYKADELLKSKKNIKERLINEIMLSEKKLKKKIYAILLNNYEAISGKKGKKLYKALIFLKKEKYITKFGYSIYSFKNLINICNDYKPDIIQCPFNAIDRRLTQNKYINYLKRKKIKVHVRSIFLQGLLLMEINKLPKKFNKWNYLFKKWHKWLKEKKIDPLSACCSFVFNFKSIDKFVIGFNDFNQFNKIFKMKNFKKFKYPNVSCLEEDLINPSRW